jgi:hypothetical protein
MTTLASRVRIPGQVTYSQVGGELVLLNLESGQYYGLDEVGARMFVLLAEHGGLEAAYQALLVEYEVEAGRLEGDLIALADDLAAHGLLAFVETSTP